MASIRPYKIEVPEEKLQRLRQKLALADFPGELEEAEWIYGSPLKDIKELTKYWLEEYDWRATEAELNKLPNFETLITVERFEPLNVHFIYQKSDVEAAIPLLFVHGWPGSFLEVTKMLPLLKGADGNTVFHVVAPSLPNYGFSSRVTKKGFGLGQYAETCHKLMLALGYDQYVTQGGDWGAFITRIIGLRYPSHCKASHINMAYATEAELTTQSPKPSYTPREKASLAIRAAWEIGDERGYFAIQSTKPATLAFSLHDSPTGLLAWIYDKLISWTDAYPWTPTEILTWVSIYLFSTSGPTASIYTYYSVLHDTSYPISLTQQYINIPLGIADFPKEVLNSPKIWRQSLGPVVSDMVFEKGGHFAAWERPGDLAGQLCRMFGVGVGADGKKEHKSRQFKKIVHRQSHS